MTNTLLVGEKNIPPNGFSFTQLDCGMFDGHNIQCNTRAGGLNFPIATDLYDPGWKFGSWHPGICQFAFCDGTVRPIAVTIDPFVLGLLAQRNDGQVIPDY